MKMVEKDLPKHCIVHQNQSETETFVYYLLN